jgi:hypothetical protein
MGPVALSSAVLGSRFPMGHGHHKAAPTAKNSRAAGFVKFCGCAFCVRDLGTN